MDGSRFDAWTRRRFGLAAGGVAAALWSRAGPGFGVAAAKKRKQKLKRNAFGCVDVGGKCRGKDKHCCSGVCRGKKPKKGGKDTSRCVAHDTGGCTATDSQCGMMVPSCTTSTGRAGGCVTTTGNATYCADWVTAFPCTKDADCRPYCGPLAACHVNTCSGMGGCAGPGECEFP